MNTFSFGSRKFRSLLTVAGMSMCAEYLMGFADSIITGNLFGETGLAGLNLCEPIIETVSFVATMVGSGTAIRFTTEAGRFDKKRAMEMFSQGVFCAFLFGVLLMVLLWLGRDWYLHAMGANESVSKTATDYWNWFIPVAFFSPLAILLSSSCYADGDNKLCMTAYAIQLGSNCILSVVLGKFMGIAGCALGTALGNMLAALLLISHFFRKCNTLQFVCHFSFKDLCRICSSSFGSSSVHLWLAALLLFLDKYLLSHFGEGMLAVLSVAFGVLGISETFSAVPNAAQPVVSVYVGEKNNIGVRSVMRSASVTAAIVGGTFTLCFLVCPQIMLKLVGLDDPALVSNAMHAVRLVCIPLTFTALITLFNSYFLYINHTTLAAVSSFLNSLAIPVTMICLLGRAFGVNGVWFGMGCASLITTVLISAYLIIRYGKKQYPLLLDNSREENLRVWNLNLNEQEICSVTAEAGALLRQRNVSDDTQMRVQLLIEEVFMAVKDRNAKKVVHAEVFLDLNDSGVTLVMRDDGIVFDITEADPKIENFRMFMVSALMSELTSRIYLTTTGYNRNAFKFEK